MILQSLLNILLVAAGVLLGGYILFAGRRSLWATLGIVALVAAANLLAVLVAGVGSGWELLELQAWPLLGIAAVVGVLGMIAGRYWPDIAVPVIGFIAGASIALWLYDIVAYGVTDMANLSAQVAEVLGWVLILIGGLFGLWLVRQSRDEALILITIFIGVELIQDVLQLSKTSSWTAILVLSLALAGVLVQYAYYLRETKAVDQGAEPIPAPSSVAYFQDLELEG